MSSSVWLTDLSTTTSTTNAQSKCFDCGSCCGLKYLRQKRAKIRRPHCDSTCTSDSTNRNLPFSEKLPEDLVLVEGKGIFIQGKALQNCTRFSINLLCDKNVKNLQQDPNIAFHFNPRLEQRYVVRNCWINGYWGDEETSSCAKFPFAPEKPFRICIFLSKGEFLVAVDGKHFCGYSYRVPLLNVCGIEVVGKVEVNTVEYRNLDRYPELTNENFAKRIPDESESQLEENDLTLPFTGCLPHGFTIGNELEIHGRVKILPHSFYLNLQSGSQVWPHPNIPLHLNPRFKTSIGEHVLIRNAWCNGLWGKEERLPGNHFQPGVHFVMAVRKESDKYSLWLNGKLSGEFPFRTDNEDVDVVHMQGDVAISKILIRSNKH